MLALRLPARSGRSDRTALAAAASSKQCTSSRKRAPHHSTQSSVPPWGEPRPLSSSPLAATRLRQRRGPSASATRRARRRRRPSGAASRVARRCTARTQTSARSSRRRPELRLFPPPRRTQTPLREAHLPGAGGARALEPLRAAPRAGGRPAAGGGRAHARPQQPDGLPRRVAILLRAPHRGRRAAGPLLPPLGRTASPRPLERHSSLPPPSPPPTHAATTRHRLPRRHPPPAPPPALPPPPPPRQRPPPLAPRSPATLPRPGAPKQWYIVPPAHAARVRRLAADVCASEAAECSHFLRHKQTLLAPSVYRASNVPLRRALQTEGTFVVVQALPRSHRSRRAGCHARRRHRPAPPPPPPAPAGGRLPLWLQPRAKRRRGDQLRHGGRVAAHRPHRRAVQLPRPDALRRVVLSLPARKGGVAREDGRVVVLCLRVRRERGRHQLRRGQLAPDRRAVRVRCLRPVGPRRLLRRLRGADRAERRGGGAPLRRLPRRVARRRRARRGAAPRARATTREGVCLHASEVRAGVAIHLRLRQVRGRVGRDGGGGRRRTDRPDV